MPSCRCCCAAACLVGMRLASRLLLHRTCRSSHVPLVQQTRRAWPSPAPVMLWRRCRWMARSCTAGPWCLRSTSPGRACPCCGAREMRWARALGFGPGLGSGCGCAPLLRACCLHASACDKLGLPVSLSCPRCTLRCMHPCWKRAASACPFCPSPQVAAGSLNRDGVLVLRALRPAEESTPARIARLTLDAQVAV